MLPEKSIADQSKLGYPRTNELTTESENSQRLRSVYYSQQRGNTTTSLGPWGSFADSEGIKLFPSVNSFVPTAISTPSLQQAPPPASNSRHNQISKWNTKEKADKVGKLPFYCLTSNSTSGTLDHSSTNIRFNKLLSPLHLSSHASNIINKNYKNTIPSPHQIFIKQPSSVLYVKGIDPSIHSPKEITNLFSCYGNVDICIVHNAKCFALVKLSSVEGASLALFHLNKLKLCGSRLKIFYSKFLDIHEKRFVNTKSFYQPPADYHRFSQDSCIEANPVGRTLQVRILTNKHINYSGGVTDHQIHQIIDEVVQCLRIYSYRDTDNSNSWIIEFATQSAALHALMSLHDTNTAFGKLKISFYPLQI